MRIVYPSGKRFSSPRLEKMCCLLRLRFAQACGEVTGSPIFIASVEDQKTAMRPPLSDPLLPDPAPAAKHAGNTPTLQEAHARVAHLIGEVAREWRFQMNRTLKPLGLSLSTRQVLMQLHRRGGKLGQGDLARRLGIESPTLVPLLDDLERKQWIRRESDPDDARRKTVVLTPRGAKQIPALEALSVELRHTMMCDMQQDEIETLALLLSRVRDNMFSEKEQS
jgi:MarR family transcriptional regulator, transcriptional regulator for hemolysin